VVGRLRRVRARRLHVGGRAAAARLGRPPQPLARLQLAQADGRGQAQLARRLRGGARRAAQPRGPHGPRGPRPPGPLGAQPRGRPRRQPLEARRRGQEGEACRQRQVRAAVRGHSESGHAGVGYSGGKCISLLQSFFIHPSVSAT